MHTHPHTHHIHHTPCSSGMQTRAALEPNGASRTILVGNPSFPTHAPPFEQTVQQIPTSRPCG